MDYVKGLVSVVIPTHNREDLIGRAVDSAVGQTYKSIEIIVVSDGSEDSTDEIMSGYEKKYSNVRYISYHPGQGGNHARNEGIRAARGEWVAFLDDDDEWHPDKIARQLHAAEKDPEVGLVCTAINSVDDASGKSNVYIPPAPRDCSVEILRGNCIGSTTTVMMKHTVLDECGLFDEKLMAMQDYELWIRACQYTKVACVRKPCVEYHNLLNNGQISWNYRKYAGAADFISRKHARLRRSKLTARELRDIAFNDNLSISRKAMKTEQSKVCRSYALKAMIYKFSPKPAVYIAASFFPIKIVRKVNGLINKG